MYLHDNMPKPNPSQNRQSQFKITERHNYYVIREKDLTPKIQEWRQRADHDVIFLRESVGEKRGQKFSGIRGIYQIRVNNQVDDEQSVLYRNITCAFVACIQSNYDACLTDATWTHKSLNNDAAQERRQAAINQREANLDLAALENEEQQANAFAVGDMNATWAQKGERAIEISKKRGNTTAKRDLA
jgi:hypothetical protein